MTIVSMIIIECIMSFNIYYNILYLWIILLYLFKIFLLKLLKISHCLTILKSTICSVRKPNQP